MRLPPWDDDNSLIEEEPYEGVNWGLLLIAGACLLFWAVIVYVAAKGIQG